MGPMSTRSAEYLEAIDHLPLGATLVFRQVSWEQYEELLEDLGDRPGLRVSYDEGRLEIMSPLPEREEYKDSIYSLVRAFAEELGITLETRGSATWKRRKLRKGSSVSSFFPGLTAQLLTEFLDLSKSQDQTKALTAFRRRIRARKSTRQKR